MEEAEPDQANHVKKTSLFRWLKHMGLNTICQRVGIDNDNIKNPGNTYVKVCHSDEERGQLVITEWRCVLQPSENCQHKSWQVVSVGQSFGCVCWQVHEVQIPLCHCHYTL